MTNVFTLEKNQDFSEQINIDDLYETKHKDDLNKLELFNKILNRIHVKIKTVSKQKMNDQYCWFLVPEIIIGVPILACSRFLCLGNLLLANSIAPRLKVFTDGRSAAGRDLYTG